MPPKTVANIAGKRHVSKSALSTILQSVKDFPEILEESGLSRQGIKRARDQAINVQTPMGPILRSLTFPNAGGDIRIEQLGSFDKGFVCHCHVKLFWCMILENQIYFLCNNHGW